MAKSIDCRCTYNFTCGVCLSNPPAWVWSPSTAAEQIARIQEQDKKRFEGKK